jgi:hypothetical protein
MPVGIHHPTPKCHPLNRALPTNLDQWAVHSELAVQSAANESRVESHVWHLNWKLLAKGRKTLTETRGWWESTGIVNRIQLEQ